MIAALLLSLVTWAEHTWVLIAQRPDAPHAVSVPLSASFVACCDAFTGSSAAVRFPRDAATTVTATTILTARSPIDAVRIRAYSYVPDAVGACCVQSDPSLFGPVSPPTVLLPRVVAIQIPTAWWNARDGDWYFVAEFVGAPLVYGVSITERRQQ